MKKITLSLVALCMALGLMAETRTFNYNDLYAGELSVMGTPMKLPDFSKWHYFAFDEEEGVVLKGTSDFDLGTLTAGLGTEVINTTWQARTDWDIAFHAYDVRTNSGAAGNGGAGAVFIADAASANGKTLDQIFSELTSAPDVDYAADTELTGMFYLSLTSGMPPHRTTMLSVCTATRKAAEDATGASEDFSALAMGSDVTDNPMIIVFKTTTGKYVKVYLKQFVGTNDEPGMLIMDYDFIPLEGSTSQEGTFTYNDLYAGELSVMGTLTKLPDFSQWHYFAFDEEEGVVLKGKSEFDLGTLTAGIGTEVINTTWKERTDWDIAFHAYDIRTNSGTAGNGGAGAVFIADEASANGKTLDEIFEELTSAPNVNYAADTELTGVFYLSLTSGMPPHRTTMLSVCAATKKAAEGTTGASEDFSSLAMGSTATDNPMIVVFKTTSGKYVKVYLKQFVGTNDEPGMLVMDYAFIPLASTSGVHNVNNNSFAMYPNPAVDAVNVELNDNATITVFNLTGAVVKQISNASGNVQIQVSDLNKGTYIVKAGNAVKKLVVE